MSQGMASQLMLTFLLERVFKCTQKMPLNVLCWWWLTVFGAPQSIKACLFYSRSCWPAIQADPPDWTRQGGWHRAHGKIKSIHTSMHSKYNLHDFGGLNIWGGGLEICHIESTGGGVGALFAGSVARRRHQYGSLELNYYTAIQGIFI